MSEDQAQELAILTHAIMDIERAGDHANNLAELMEKKTKEDLVFSSEATEEIKSMFNKVRRGYDKAIYVLKNRDEELGRKVLEIEREVDVMERDFVANHTERLRKGICDPIAGPLFVDMVRNLERISDHAHNIVNSVLIGF